MAKERAPLRCHGCGNEMPREHGSDLHHGPKCELLRRDKIRTALKQLKKAGFVQLRNIPNVWKKDGVAVTLEQVLHHGFKETITKHQAASGILRGATLGKAKRAAGKKPGAR